MNLLLGLNAPEKRLASILAHGGLLLGGVALGGVFVVLLDGLFQRLHLGGLAGSVLMLHTNQVGDTSNAQENH